MIDPSAMCSLRSIRSAGFLVVGLAWAAGAGCGGILKTNPNQEVTSFPTEKTEESKETEPKEETKRVDLFEQLGLRFVNAKEVPAEPAEAPEADDASTGEAATVAAAGATDGSTRPAVGRSRASEDQRRWVLAVMDTEMSGGKRPFNANTLRALTDQIRVFLAERGMRVIDRSSQEAALKELVNEEKRNSYKECMDSSCQIPLGKALAASHLMRSSVAKFGTACATNGELIDLREEVTVAAGSARSGCEEEDLLYASESLAEQLVRSSKSNP